MNWIKIEPGCEMPQECQSVLVTIWEDCSYGHGSDIQLHSDAAVYHEDDGYIKSANKNARLLGETIHLY